ncbi:MAG: hypothetical protein ACOX6H_03150 [Christensenellales bacterium]|jgi:preprotein translocase SecF subunit
MTKNKFNLEEKINNSNINVISRFKYLIIAPAVLLVIALTLLFTVGFNKSIEFTGGVNLRVYIGTESEYSQAKEKVDEVLHLNGLEASVYQTAEHEDKLFLNVKYKKDASLTEEQNEDLNNKVINDLFAKFGFDKEDFEQKNYVVGNQPFDASVGQAALKNTFIVVVVASILSIIYFIIRFGHQIAMTALLGIYHDILIAICFTLICRVEINLTLMPAILTIMALSFIMQVLYFSNVKENTKNIEKGTKAEEIATTSLKQGLKTQIVVSLFVILAVLLLNLIGNTSILSYSLITFFGILSANYSLVALLPALWSFIFVPSKKKPRPVKQKEEVV